MFVIEFHIDVNQGIIKSKIYLLIILVKDKRKAYVFSKIPSS